MHTLRDFKSFRDAELDLFKNVTVLIGKNGSGKTNAIEGVELLAHLAHGLPLFEISDLGRSGRTYEIRGGLRDCVRRGADCFNLGMKARGTFDGKREVYEYSLSIAAEPEPYVFSEKLTVGDRIVFSGAVRKPGGLLDVSYDNFARGPLKPTVTISSDRSILSRYSSFTSFPEQSNIGRRRSAIEATVQVSNYLKASFVFDPSSRGMRNYENIGQSVLRRDGSNLSAVLYSLSIGSDSDKEALKRILRLVSQLPEEPFVDFEFVTTAQRDVLFGLKRTDGTLIDARMLSDGTLRALAILVALETAPPKSRVIVEEVDNGVHPSRTRILMEALWEVSHRRALNVLATTHNPSFMNALSAEQLNSVVLCVFDKEESASRLIVLKNLPRAEGIFLNGQLGDLVARDALERFLQQNFEGQQRQAFSNWLASVQ